MYKLKLGMALVGLPWGQRPYPDDRLPLALGHQLRGDSEYPKVRAQHQVHREQVTLKANLTYSVTGTRP